MAIQRSKSVGGSPSQIHEQMKQRKAANSPRVSASPSTPETPNAKLQLAALADKTKSRQETVSHESATDKSAKNQRIDQAHQNTSPQNLEQNPQRFAKQIKNSDSEVLAPFQDNHNVPSKHKGATVNAQSIAHQKSQLKSVSQHQVLNLDKKDAGVSESARSIALKDEGSAFAPERLGSKSTLEVVGHGDGMTLGGQSPEELAEMLKGAKIKQLAVLDLKSCHSEDFKTKLQAALKKADITVGEIRTYEGEIAIDRGSGKALQGQDIAVKSHDGALDLRILNRENRAPRVPQNTPAPPPQDPQVYIPGFPPPPPPQEALNVPQQNHIPNKQINTVQKRSDDIKEKTGQLKKSIKKMDSQLTNQGKEQVRKKVKHNANILGQEFSPETSNYMKAITSKELSLMIAKELNLLGPNTEIIDLNHLSKNKTKFVESIKEGFFQGIEQRSSELMVKTIENSFGKKQLNQFKLSSNQEQFYKNIEKSATTFSRKIDDKQIIWDMTIRPQKDLKNDIAKSLGIGALEGLNETESKLVDHIFNGLTKGLPNRMDENRSIFIKGKEYTQTKELGKGGFGKVFLFTATAEDTEPKTIAIKESLNPEDRSDFAFELEEYRHIMGPAGEGENNIAKMLGAVRGPDDGLYMAMETLGGGDFRNQIVTQNLSKEMGLTSDLSHEILMLSQVKQMIEGMSYLNDDIGIVHHDLKPENIFMDQSGNLKIGDFGSSLQKGQRIDLKGFDFESMGRVIGKTGAFMDPSFGSRGQSTEVTPKYDSFSQGFILNAMLGGGDAISEKTKEELKEDRKARSHDDSPLGKMVQGLTQVEHENRLDISSLKNDPVFNSLEKVSPDTLKQFKEASLEYNQIISSETLDKLINETIKIENSSIEVQNLLKEFAPKILTGQTLEAAEVERLTQLSNREAPDAHIAPAKALLELDAHFQMPSNLLSLKNKLDKIIISDNTLENKLVEERTFIEDTINRFTGPPKNFEDDDLTKLNRIYDQTVSPLSELRHPLIELKTQEKKLTGKIMDTDDKDVKNDLKKQREDNKKQQENIKKDPIYQQKRNDIVAKIKVEAETQIPILGEQKDSINDSLSSISHDRPALAELGPILKRIQTKTPLSEAQKEALAHLKESKNDDVKKLIVQIDRFLGVDPKEVPEQISFKESKLKPAIKKLTDTDEALKKEINSD